MKYQVLYNFDPTFLVSTPPKNGTYDEPLTKEYIVKHVNEAADHGVDVFMCCPNMLGRKLWDSKHDPHWSKEAPYRKLPEVPWEWEFDDKCYYRMRNYILGGGKPVEEIYNAVRERGGMSFFFTYRMNDCHYLEKETSNLHDTFWLEHPEWRIGDYGGAHPNMHHQLASLLRNYMYPEVRQHVLDILTELVTDYDVDGLELDLMRKPCLVPFPNIEEGREIITDFVGQIRSMLDEFGAKRNKRIQLCVRVPHSLKDSYELAMDIGEWDRRGYIEMVNVSTSFLTNIMALNIESYTSALKNSKVYGEMHYSLSYGEKWPNYGRRFIRNTTKEMYETGAFLLKKRGAFGVSLFNFVGSRQHEFNDPRAKTYPGAEPPFEAVSQLANEEYLETCDKHYVINRFIVDGREYPGCAVPVVDEFKMDFMLFEADISKNYKRAVLRVETGTSNQHIPMVTTINGQTPKPLVGTGELFTPVSIEGLPRLENCRYYEIAIDTLKSGINQIEIYNDMKTHPKEFLTFNCVEIALFSRRGKND